VLHTLDKYTARDLKAAYTSLYQPEDFRAEIEREIDKRKFAERLDIDYPISTTYE